MDQKPQMVGITSRYFLKAFLAALLLAGLPVRSVAESIPPWDVKVQTVRYQPGRTDFPLGSYEYDIAWQGIPVATARIGVESERRTVEPMLRVVADCWSARGVKWFYNLTHRTESLFYPRAMQPVRFLSTQVENSKEHISVVDWNADGKVSARRWKNGKPSPVEEFSTDNPMLDPVTAIFLARSLPAEVGQERAFDVYNGKNRFLITLKVESREKIRIKDREHDSFKVVPSVKKLTDTEGEKKLKSAVFWVSADEHHDILKLESKVWIGKVTAVLRNISTSPRENPVPVSMQTKLTQMLRDVAVN